MVDVNIKVPALEKLLDYAASGIGAVAGSMLAPWKAQQDAKAKLIGAKADADSLRLIADAQAEARRTLVSPDESRRGTFEIDREQITQRLEFQEKKRQRNIASVVHDAAVELGDKEVPNHEPDHDWTARLFEGVQDVSSHDVRKIWAKILAGEVETPGGVSLRTLSILKNMSRQEANLFSEAMRYRLEDFILEGFCLRTSKILKQHHLTFTFENIGLFYSPIGPRPSRLISTGKEGRKIMLNCNNVLILEGKPNHSVDIDAKIILKEPAIELARFCGAESEPEYLRYFAKHLSKKHCTLQIAPIISVSSDGEVSYYPKDLRVIEPAP